MSDSKTGAYHRLRDVKDALRHSRYLRHILAARRAHTLGLRSSAIRYRLTSSILRTAPCPVGKHAGEGDVEIHLVCYWRDYLQAMWALKTFYRFASVNYPLVVHIDGFVTHRMIRAFTRHFPGVTIVERNEADRIVRAFLADRRLDNLLSEHTRNVFVRKMLDVHVLARSSKILVMDSDVLFFNRPVELLDTTLQGHDALFMRDCSCCYTAPVASIERIVGTPVMANLNAGLLLMKREALNLATMEDCLQHSELTQGDPAFLEQTLYAAGLCASKVSYLPPSYLLSMELGVRTRELVARHYAGNSRELMTNEGMTHLISQGFLKAS